MNKDKTPIDRWGSWGLGEEDLRTALMDVLAEQFSYDDESLEGASLSQLEDWLSEQLPEGVVFAFGGIFADIDNPPESYLDSAWEAWCSELALEYSPDEHEDKFEELYVGSYESIQAFAEEYFENNFEVPDALITYIDFASLGHDLMMDHAGVNVSGLLHVFRSY